MARPSDPPLRSPGGRVAGIRPPPARPARCSFAGTGISRGGGGGFSPLVTASYPRGLPEKQRLRPCPPAPRPSPPLVPSVRHVVRAFVDPGYDGESELNPFILGGGITTAADSPLGRSQYGSLLQAGAGPLPFYPAPLPSEILPTRLIFPGVLNPPQTRLQPVPGNPVISAANQAWYDSLGIPVDGGAPVSGLGGPPAAEAIPSRPNPFADSAPLDQPFVQYSVHNVIWLGVWINLSAYFEKAAAVQLFGALELDDALEEGNQTELAFTTIDGNRGILDRTSNAPALTQVEGAGYFGWLGCCRAMWPLRDQCWWLSLLCGLEKYGVAIVAILMLFIELVLLESILFTDFICVVPRTSTWKDVLTADIPIAPRLATLVVYFCFWPCLLGYCFEKMSPTAYFRQLGGGRVLLRSLAANYEARTYSYCNLIFWTILIEIDSVIVPAYFPIVIALITLKTYQGNIDQAASLLSVTWLTITIHTNAAYLVHLLACLPGWLVDSTHGTSAGGPSASDFVRGSRVDGELGAFNKIYLWNTGLCYVFLLILIKTQTSLLYLWSVPFNAALYCLLWQWMPYCLHGWVICPPHTGPCVSVTAIATTVVFLLLFSLNHACFLFPCLCAPEVPGYLFFPPDGQTESPLTGAYDVSSYRLLLRRLAPGGEPTDCVWEPPKQTGDAGSAAAAHHGGSAGSMPQAVAGTPAGRGLWETGLDDGTPELSHVLAFFMWACA